MKALHHTEIRLHLEIPQSIVLPDGTIAMVKGIAAKVANGALHQIIFTVEKESGAWTEVSADEVQVRQRPTSAN